MFEIEMTKIIGAPLAGIAMFAGLGVWVAVGSWVEICHRVFEPINRWNRPTAVADFMIPAVITLSVVGLHFVMVGLRWLITRREKTVGFRSSFWRVLMTVGYWTGFAGGQLIYLTAPV